MTTLTTTQQISRGVWQLDPSHTSVELAVKHMVVTTVKGLFSKVSGTIVLDEADLTRSTAEVEIEAASIDTRDEQRDAHLRSADFLDVENHRRITFVSKKITPKGGNRYAVVGDLTIRGVTREVVLDAEYHGQGKDPWGGTRAGFSASTTINRKDWGLNWNTALEAGGLLVGEEVKISADVEAIKG